MAAKRKAAGKRRKARQAKLRPPPLGPGESNPPHRPSAYTPELGERVCEVYATDPRTLHELCEQHPDFPLAISTMDRWMDAHEEFRTAFTRAKRRHAARQIDAGLRAIRDVDPDKGFGVGQARVARAKAEADFRARIAASIDPETWSERRRVDHGGEVGVRSKPDLSQLSDDELRQALALARKAKAAPQA